MTDSIQPARVEILTSPRGTPLKRICIGETGSYIIAANDLPSPINRTALDVVDIMASTLPGMLVLKPKSPPTVTTEEFGPDIILQIEPKYGPAALVQLLLLADEPGLILPDQQVWYGLEANVTVLEVLSYRLLERLEEINTYGWAGGDVEQVIVSDSIEGQLLPIESLLDSIGRGEITLTQRVARFTYDIALNRVIFATLDFVAASSYSLSPGTNNKLFEILASFPRITPLSNAAEAATLCRLLLERDLVPPNREYYTPILSLCLLLLERFALTQAGEPELDHPPLRLPMARLFERMVRNIVAQALAPQWVVRSAQDDVLLGGHTQLYAHAEPLGFNTILAPDIIIRSSNDIRRIAAIFDVKYKFNPSNDDHYQLNAYLSAFRVPLGGFFTLGTPNRQIYRAQGYTNNIVYSYSFNIANIQQEIVYLRSWIRDVLQAK